MILIEIFKRNLLIIKAKFQKKKMVLIIHG